ncbi:MAG: glycoside hydrolase family 3 N-terminal domain-containing protein [Parabacteroides gordonii]|uniref:glycoside hydrolase family 3 N-terminal domain-containing protein n=1 Tax=Parabacteroides gordonii TaxID=574930 RepID=UPI003A83B83E
MKTITHIAITTLLFYGGTLMAQEYPYKDSRLPVEERVQDLLSRMTMEEKIGQLSMKSLKALELDNNNRVTDSSLVNLFAGESIGCLESPFVEHDKVAIYSEAADHYFRTKTRLGIPAIQIAECLHGQMALGTTIFPQAIGLGCTWNPALIKQMASVIAEEASLSGVDQALSPLFDLARDPRYGRVEECYGEDPYLVKEMGVAYVTGMQGEPEVTRSHIPAGKLACTAKHFVAYSVPEAGINLAPSLVGERTLRELHFYPFEAVVRDANVYSVMPGYHEVDGVPVHASRWLLTDVLRKEWGFNGYIFSDYGAIGMLDNFHKTAHNKAESAYQAITAGVDLEAPGRYAYGELEGLVRNGKLPQAVVDTAVSNILRVKFKMGLFDRPYRKPEALAKKVHKKESISLAQQIAEESIVLLKNSDNLLPLDKKKIKSVAVIGPNADKVQFGDYSITKNNDYGTTILEGIRSYVGNDLKVNYAEGCGITNLSKAGFEEAVRLVGESDVVVLVLGGTSVIYSGIGWGDPNSKEVNTCGEGYDRNELNFPGVQPELLDRITSLGKPVVLVMLNGRPYAIENEIAKVGAVLEAWYPGEKGGDAVARILFGEVNPSGRLSVSFPKTTGHIPVYANYKPSGRGYYNRRGTPEKPGRDYVFSSPDPLFCFGYGLSYTTFDYSDIHVNNYLNTGGDVVEVYCRIRNTGNRAGAEVVQLYVRDLVSSVTTPVKALKAFDKVFLQPGEEKQIKFQVNKNDLRLWNVSKQWVLEPGEFEVYLGASSEDIKLKSRFTVK